MSSLIRFVIYTYIIFAQVFTKLGWIHQVAHIFQPLREFCVLSLESSDFLLIGLLGLPREKPFIREVKGLPYGEGYLLCQFVRNEHKAGVLLRVLFLRDKTEESLLGLVVSTVGNPVIFYIKNSKSKEN